MKNSTKFFLINSFFLLCGISMAFNPSKRSKEVKVVVSVKEVKEGTTEVTRELDSLPFREQVYIYLTEEKNLSRNKALGLIANGDRESNWRFGIWNPSETSVGIFQWTGVRRDKFLKAVPDYKTNWKAQVDYALKEDKGPQYRKMKFASPQAAATWFMQHWERPANPERCRARNNKFLASYTF